jgi:hypothetical protein
MGHGRRQILWFGVTPHPTAEWTANQITEACGWEQVPRYLIRDRDGAYGEVFIRRLRSMGIRDRPTSPRSPWQNGFVERLIGSIRRECLDHVVVFAERHLCHVLLSYMNYYNEMRTHLSMGKDAPVPRAVERGAHQLSTCTGRVASSIPPDLIYDRHTRIRDAFPEPLPMDDYLKWAAATLAEFTQDGRKRNPVFDRYARVSPPPSTDDAAPINILLDLSDSFNDFLFASDDTRVRKALVDADHSDLGSDVDDKRPPTEAA